MTNQAKLSPWPWVAVLPLLLAGCGQGRVASGTKPVPQAAAPAATNAQEEAEIGDARRELSADDRRLVELQEFCPVMPDKRLGVMGKPIKVVVKDQPVFVCCKGCVRKAQRDADLTLARVEELKAKVAAGAVKK